MTDDIEERLKRLALVKDILIIINLLWLLIFFIFLFLDGFKLIEFTPGVAEGSGP